LVFFTGSQLEAGPVLYTFSGTTVVSPHSQAFQLLLPDFLPVVLNGPFVSFLSTDGAVLSCVPCNIPPVPALSFRRAETSLPSDYISFSDIDDVGYDYYFSLGAFSSVGTYQTLPGVNVNTGTLVVAAVPEPFTLMLLMIGFGVLGRYVPVLIKA
jgi:hypothetical protein